MIKQDFSYRDQRETQRKVMFEGMNPTCFHCGKKDCYALFPSDTGQLTHTLLFDEKHIICENCWGFLNIGGKISTKILRLLFKVNIFFRKKNT